MNREATIMKNPQGIPIELLGLIQPQKIAIPLEWLNGGMSLVRGTGKRKREIDESEKKYKRSCDSPTPLFPWILAVNHHN